MRAVRRERKRRRGAPPAEDAHELKLGA